MSKTCYNCGTENADTERFCHNCGASLADQTMKNLGIQGGPGEERIIWDNGEIQLTTQAVLIGMDTDEPDVVPLNVLYDLELDENCVVLKVKEGDDRYCMVDDPTELADLIRDQMNRPRLAHGRGDKGYIPPE